MSSSCALQRAATPNCLSRTSTASSRRITPSTSAKSRTTTSSGGSTHSGSSVRRLFGRQRHHQSLHRRMVDAQRAREQHHQRRIHTSVGDSDSCVSGAPVETEIARPMSSPAIVPSSVAYFTCGAKRGVTVPATQRAPDVREQQPRRNRQHEQQQRRDRRRPRKHLLVPALHRSGPSNTCSRQLSAASSVTAPETRRPRGPARAANASARRRPRRR